MTRPRLISLQCVSLQPVVALLSLACIAFLAACNGHTNATPVEPVAKPAAPSTQTVVINHLKFTMELALTEAQRMQGLSDRASIAQDGGMLFVFPEPEETSFVMRRCLVPIDILFVKEDGTITAMYEMKVEPYDTHERDLVRYPSRGRILFALEFKAGTLARLGLRLGDKVDLPYADLKARAE